MAVGFSERLGPQCCSPQGSHKGGHFHLYLTGCPGSNQNSTFSKFKPFFPLASGHNQQGQKHPRVVFKLPPTGDTQMPQRQPSQDSMQGRSASATPSALEAVH